jgi:2-polyprenyl-3-methyl-5-hydroxy-6-metoxy-1,4-benzoquinol methylase
MRDFQKIVFCRLCSSRNFDCIIDFGKIALGNNLLNNKKKSLEVREYILKLNKCKSCGHFQLSHKINPKILFASNYTYLSGVAPSFVKHFSKYVSWIRKNCNLNKYSSVLDVGSNDGTCLKAFKKKGFNVCGIDPAKLPSDKANKEGINTINDFLNRNSSLKILKKFGKFDLITSHNVLAHVDNFKDVLNNIFMLTKDNGYFCFEVGYFKNVFENNLFDTIYHEHLDYHHAKPLSQYLYSIGFSLILFEQNSIQGGSLRVLCKKERKKKIYPKAREFINQESNMAFNNLKKLKKWENDINKKMIVFRDIINKLKSKNLNIIGYGAPTKATLLLRVAKLSHSDINYIVEDNKEKINKYLPKTGIPILPFNQIKKDYPDVIIVFAWNFISDIKEKLKKNSINIPIIVAPLPQPKIIK